MKKIFLVILANFFLFSAAVAYAEVTFVNRTSRTIQIKGPKGDMADQVVRIQPNNKINWVVQRIGNIKD